jgi:hypothetical protein
MKNTGLRIIEDEELILEIALFGCFKYKEEMETLALDQSFPMRALGPPEGHFVFFFFFLGGGIFEIFAIEHIFSF